jgi:hypothetical protein
MASGGTVSLATATSHPAAPEARRRPAWGKLYAVLPITALCSVIGYRLESAGGHAFLLQGAVVLVAMALLFAWTRAQRSFLLGQTAGAPGAARPLFSVIRLRLSSGPRRLRHLSTPPSALRGRHLPSERPAAHSSRL